MGFADGTMVDFSALTATAVLGWYAWHTTYFTIPHLVTAFREECSAMRAESAEERVALHAELSAERNQRHTHHVMVVEALRDLAHRLPN